MPIATGSAAESHPHVRPSNTFLLSLVTAVGEKLQAFVMSFLSRRTTVAL